MARGSVDNDFLFALGEVQRLLRAYADKEAARYGITRAQWAVLAKVERNEGHETVRTCGTVGNAADHFDATGRSSVRRGWIERRGDETDRRINRLYLRKAARPLLGKLTVSAPN